MPDLTYQRCFNHAGREAVAQCPSCRRFFCRECVTEHDDRVVCAECLKGLTRPALLRRAAMVNVLRLARATAGILIAWFFFFFIGQQLLALPDTFHQATLWRPHWTDQP